MNFLFSELHKKTQPKLRSYPRPQQTMRKSAKSHYDINGQGDENKHQDRHVPFQSSSNSRNHLDFPPTVSRHLHHDDRHELFDQVCFCNFE